MLQVINYLRLSRTDSDEISVIEAKQGDNQGDICQIEIYDNQDIVDLSQFDDILFTANKPDHSSVLFRLSDNENLIKNNNTLNLTLTSVLLSVHGTVECEISLYNDDIIKSTYNFNIYVFKSPSSFDVMNDSDITTIKNAVSNIISSTLKAQESEKNAKQSEINSKKSEDSASVSANLASSKASEASSNATAAKTSETNSKVSEIASAKSENNALNYANQALASKDAAKTSETNAKKSETNAANSEKNATNKVTEASNSATLSKSYAVGGTGTRTNENTDNAKYYKEQASLSEKSSSTSAINAKESEKNALSSANIATDKASQAATSEENAANSANSASASATTASTKATEASNSAKSAATSATSASNSATSAKNYADSWKGSLLPQGDITFSQLPTSGMIKGYMYSITNFFNTDSRFEGGANFFYPAGTCVYWTENNQWKCLSGVLSRKISQADYDALSESEKNNGTIYYIEDGDNLMKVATTSANGLMSSTDKIKLNYTNIAYATCVTAAETAAKVATISGNSNWTLQVGSIVVVKYTYTNTASSCTLNVNSTGAKSFWYSNAKYAGNSNMVCGYANKCIMYMYDGTYWVWITHGADNNTTYSNMTAATSNTAGKAGLVPAPAAGAQGKYLRGDGTWQTPPDTNTTYSVATQSANGLLSASDKKKLDGITSGANAKFISLTQTEYDNLKTKESNVIYFITDAD